MAKLLIVESPGKLKTLRKILGPGWILEASVGHTTELASDGRKRLGFDMKDGKIDTRYVPRAERGRQVLARLRKAAKQAEEVYLATDPDREGEAIAWHLARELHLKRIIRVAYTQITESAVRAAIARPRGLDIPLVEAQRARQCLDKLVGYEVSPLLWDSTGGRSAGRVQSATLHLICERERERLAFKPEDYWQLTARYLEGFEARFEPAAKRDDAERVATQAEADRIAAIARAAPHMVRDLTRKEERRSPPPPLITSSLQQMAGARYRYSPKKTMELAQELYEAGRITYMRTDAVALSPEFVAEARTFLTEKAPQALAERPPFFRIKEDAQGAHEAIRPTSAMLTPEQATMLSPDQKKIYTLIWERAIASQCKPAVLARTTVEILAGQTRWIGRGMMVVDPGYLRFWKNVQDELELPPLRVGQMVNLMELDVAKKTTEPPSRFSEPKLVQLMEKLGIGRPSTYASTIATLKDRDYTILEKSLLAPTALGLATDQALGLAMPDLIDARFTAEMESSLDRIAASEVAWERYLCDWNERYLAPALIRAREKLRGVARVAPERPRKTGARKTAAAKLDPAAAPDCAHGHGKLAARVSKKGHPYWKCAVRDCESWAWPEEGARPGYARQRVLKKKTLRRRRKSSKD